MDIIFTLIELRTRSSHNTAAAIPTAVLIIGVSIMAAALSLGIAFWCVSMKVQKANDIGNSTGKFQNYARTPITYVCRESKIPLRKKEDFIRAYGNTREWKIAVPGGVRYNQPVPQGAVPTGQFQPQPGAPVQAQQFQPMQQMQVGAPVQGQMQGPVQPPVQPQVQQPVNTPAAPQVQAPVAPPAQPSVPTPAQPQEVVPQQLHIDPDGTLK